jgi:hypothetical protein
MKTTVEIDCAPGNPRPDFYFNHIWTVILKRDASTIPEPISKVFGNWEWKIEYTEEEQSQVADYIKSLYHQRKIRYGSW